MAVIDIAQHPRVNLSLACPRTGSSPFRLPVERGGRLQVSGAGHLISVGLRRRNAVTIRIRGQITIKSQFVSSERQWSNTTMTPHGEIEVAEYRVCTVGADGHFTESREMICRDDGEAVARAKRMIDGHDIEVWNGNRFVIRLLHKPN